MTDLEGLEIRVSNIEKAVHKLESKVDQLVQLYQNHQHHMAFQTTLPQYPQELLKKLQEGEKNIKSDNHEK